MEIPSSAAGLLVELSVKEGDKVSQGSLIAVLEVADAAAPEVASPAAKSKPSGRPPVFTTASTCEPSGFMRRIAPDSTPV